MNCSNSLCIYYLLLPLDNLRSFAWSNLSAMFPNGRLHFMIGIIWTKELNQAHRSFLGPPKPLSFSTVCLRLLCPRASFVSPLAVLVNICLSPSAAPNGISLRFVHSLRAHVPVLHSLAIMRFLLSSPCFFPDFLLHSAFTVFFSFFFC